MICTLTVIDFAYIHVSGYWHKTPWCTSVLPAAALSTLWPRSLPRSYLVPDLVHFPFMFPWFPCCWRIWSLAFHWGVMSCKVMVIWREHHAAMSDVPLGTATLAVTRRNSVTQVLPQCLPSGLHCEVPRKHVFWHGRHMRIWSLAFHWAVMSCKVMLIWREHHPAMSAVPLGTATSAVTDEIQWHRLCCSVCHQRFHCEVLQKYALCRQENVHLTVAFTLGGAMLQGHAGLGVVALRLQWGVWFHRTCCKDFRGWGYVCMWDANKQRIPSKLHWIWSFGWKFDIYACDVRPIVFCIFFDKSQMFLNLF